MPILRFQLSLYSLLLLVSLLSVGLGPLCAPAAAQATAREELPRRIEFVEGFHSRAIRYEGPFWRRQDSPRALIGSGERRELYAAMRLLEGDFEIVFRFAAEKLRDSGAALRFGESRILIGDKRGIVLVGPLFQGGGVYKEGDAKSGRVLAGSQSWLDGAGSHEIRLLRKDGELHLEVEKESVALGASGVESFERFGIRPEKARILLGAFHAEGSMQRMPRVGRKDIAEIQPRIDKAIDRGVIWLLDHQLRDGSWGYSGERYRNGQTALSAYTLLACDVPADHPAIQRALAWLELHEPLETYALACQLMLLSRLSDPKRLPLAQKLLDQLISWQKGSWGYPWEHAMSEWHKRRGRPDLSNTQYAALGLRAAQKLGLEIPRRVWADLLKATMSYRRSPEEVTIRRPLTGTGTSTSQITGFAYRVDTGYKATGSMTAAGVAILKIIEAGLGDKVTVRQNRWIGEGVEQGIAWLDYHYDIVDNPASGGWRYYWLYGLERVGGLVESLWIGERNWYFDGATYLLDAQGGKGDWRQSYAEPDTCFALLFLKRATAPSTGGQNERQGQLWVREGPKTKIRFRVQGVPQSTMWVTGFGDSVIASYGEGDKGPYVQKIEYLIRGKSVATLPGHPKRPWDRDPYATRYRFTKRGDYKLVVRAWVRDPLASLGDPKEFIPIDSEAVTIQVPRVFPDWLMDCATQSKRNLLLDRQVLVEASSQWGNNKPDLAVDGRDSTRWISKEGDEAPTLRIDINRSVRARYLVLSPPRTRPVEQSFLYYDVAKKVRIRLDRKDVIEAELDPDPMRPTRIDLGKLRRIRRMEIRVTERQKGLNYKGRVGFSEVGLEKR
jgi:hypothetical protein